jgi:hypothetical protein
MTTVSGIEEVLRADSAARFPASTVESENLRKVLIQRLKLNMAQQ